MGILPLLAGRVLVDGQDLARMPAHRRAALGIGYMPEDRGLVPSSRWRRTSACRCGSRAS
jgi:branched-chain amino acid transport system ATP-binding protein